MEVAVCAPTPAKRDMHVEARRGFILLNHADELPRGDWLILNPFCILIRGLLRMLPPRPVEENRAFRPPAQAVRFGNSGS